jgi:uncharacterized protein YpmB
MPNQKIKRTTLKRLLNRKVRGMENMMWAVIATVLVVVVAFVMWNIFSSSASTVNAPEVQLVPQESFIVGTTANVTLKFGKGLKGVSVSLMAPSGTTMTTIAPVSSCKALGTTTPYDVYEGQKVPFQCTGLTSTPGVIYVVVKWAGGSQTIKWVVG